MSSLILKNQPVTLLIFAVLLIEGASSFAQHTNLAYTPSSSKSVIGVLNDYNIGTGTYPFINDGDLYLYQNFLNDGEQNFTTATTISYLNFVGTNQQRVRGSGFTNVLNLTFDNPTTADAIELDHNIHINGAADFTDGIVGADDALAGLMVFNASGTTINVSDNSYVDGRVQKIGNTPFTFPVWDDNGSLFKYRPIGISASDDLADAYTAQYFFENSNPSYSHENKEFVLTLIDDQEYWVLTRDVGTSKPMVTLTLDPQTTPAAILAEPNAITVVRWDGSQWINEGGVFDPTSNSTIG